MEFSHFALLIVAAAVSGVIAKIFKQPLIIGYLFAGVILGALGLVGSAETFSQLGRVGVTLLLFLVGLEMNLEDIPSLGKTVFLTALGQIVFTSIIGFFLAFGLGFSPLVSLYISIGLTFSSTIIVVKLLSEKHELSSLHGKISLGFLLVQDLVAIIILIALAGIKNGEVSLVTYILVLLKAFFLLGILWFLSKKAIKHFFARFLDSSGELVFIAAIAWALGLAAFVEGPLGLSLEIGGFLAGLTLANLPEHLQIASKTKPLRDFFLTIFFLVLGTNLILDDISKIIVPAIIFSIFVLIGNPLVVMAILGLMGYRRKTSLYTSLSVAQISEFSLILMALGLSLGHVSESDVALMVLVGVITMTLSTYMILGADKIYAILGDALRLFERRDLTEGKTKLGKHLKDHVVIIGADRTGSSIIPYFKRHYDLVVVDYNPHAFSKLVGQGINAIYGDINDVDVLEATGLRNAKLIVSTTADVRDNFLLLEHLNGVKNKINIVMKAQNNSDAIKLYEKGASYVLVPQILAGEHILHLSKTYGDGVGLRKSGEAHFKRIKKDAKS